MVKRQAGFEAGLSVFKLCLSSKESVIFADIILSNNLSLNSSPMWLDYFLSLSTWHSITREYLCHHPDIT
jgi:hypothetical protein